MKNIALPLHDKNGFMNLLEIGDFEFVDPIIKMGEIYVSNAVWRWLNMWRIDKKLSEKYSKEQIIAIGREEGFEDFKKHIDKTSRMSIPDELMKLLSLKKKKRQQEEIKKLASTTVLSTDLLMAFIYRANQEYGYTYSMYKGTLLPRGVTWNDMPRAAYKEEDGDINIWGKTPLTKGKVKSVIDDRNVTIGKFLDNGNEWHCFFYTMDGISGKEKGQGPHIHYVSHTWGHKREKVVQDLKNGEYGLNADNHIPYHRYA